MYGQKADDKYQDTNFSTCEPHRSLARYGNYVLNSCNTYKISFRLSIREMRRIVSGQKSLFLLLNVQLVHWSERKGRDVHYLRALDQASTMDKYWTDPQNLMYHYALLLQHELRRNARILRLPGRPWAQKSLTAPT